MQTSNPQPTDAQRKAAEHLTRPKPGFTAWRADRESRDKQRAEEEAVKAKAEAIANAKPGDIIEGEGIYLGKYSPKNRMGQSLKKTFNVYAAPEDLPELMNYMALVKYIAALKSWHGHDGANYESDKDIYKALKNGSYNGGWIIPPRELMGGRDPDDCKGARLGREIIQPDNMFDHQDKGSFKNTFNTTVFADHPKYPEWYWSSSQPRRQKGGEYAGYEDCHSYTMRFLSDGLETARLQGSGYLACRPVRLVPASGVSA